MSIGFLRLWRIGLFGPTAPKATAAAKLVVAECRLLLCMAALLRPGCPLGTL